MLSAISSIANADTGGFYIGGGLGLNQHEGLSKAANDNANATVAACASNGATCAVDSSADKTALGGSLISGYRFQNNTALEFGFVSLGQYSGKGNISGDVTGTADANFKGNALSFSILRFLPLSAGGSLVGKLGAAGWRVKGSASASACDAAVTICVSSSGSESKSGVSPVAGFGYEQWDRFRSVGIRVLFEVIPRAGIDPNYDTVKQVSVNLMTYF